MARFVAINTICRAEEITDLCHGSENKNHSYQKFTKCPAFGIFKIHIGTCFYFFLKRSP